MAERLLLVCTANVCRSALAAGQARLILGPRTEVHSAGVRAYPGSEMCRSAGRALEQLGAPPHWVAAHRSRPLSQEDIATSSLILTATGSQRDEIGRIDPSARDRAFTILEAARLVDLSPHDADETAGSWEQLASMLHSRRWRAAPGPGLAARPWWGRSIKREDELSLPDWHQGETRSHDRVLSSLRAAMATLLAHAPDPEAETHT